MREETKKVKQLLEIEFPDSKFRFRFCEARNYIDSSDCIKVTCDRKTDRKKVMDFLKSNTKGVAVYEKGGVGSIWERHITSQILLESKWIDFAMVEFIEID